MTWDWHYWVMLDLYLSGVLVLFGVAKRRVIPEWWEYIIWPVAVPYAALLVLVDAVRWVIQMRREWIDRG